ncbi:hypothetical protein GS909_12110 [Rhodococcus hoagii]|nr:hypothetical protein [Prescottella equi]
MHEGTTISSSVYGSVFYMTTGFHGLHVIGGLIAFVFLIVRTKVSKFTPAGHCGDRRFVLLALRRHVWIGLFATIYFIR